MARIPEEELERLKRKLSVKKLIEASGIILKSQGENFIGHCPFHNDKTPSLVVTPSKNLWNCLGACGEGGSVIDWVMKDKGIGFIKAFELLKSGEDLTLVAGSGRSITLPCPLDEKASDAELLHQVVDYYHQKLLDSKAAKKYLKDRNIYSEEAIKKFHLGFSDRTLGLRIPAKVLKAGKQLRERLSHLGIYRKSGHEHFSGSLVIPVLAAKRKVTEIYGRKITSNLRPGTPLHTYLPGPHEGIWNSDGVEGDKVILCESLIDALSFWVHGFHSVTSSYGVNGFSEEFIDLFQARNIKRVFIAYDRDEAGDKAAKKLAEKLIAEGFQVYRVLFPQKMDANEVVCKMSPAAKSLALMLNSSEWMGGGSGPVPLDVQEHDHKLAHSSDHEDSIPLAAKKEQVTESDSSLNQVTSGDNSELKVTPGDFKDFQVTRGNKEILFSFANRFYKVRGLVKNAGFDVMKVHIRVSRKEHYHMDTLDLYQARTRHCFITQAAKELCLASEVIKSDLGKILFQLEEYQDELLQKEATVTKKEIVLTDKERAAALSLLQSPNLAQKILDDFNTCGIVGEESNKLIAYLAACSRKLEDPLAIIIQSSSSAGKSSLMNAVLSFLPEEEQIKYSAMTGQSLYYMSDIDLKHKVLAICEEEGMEKASYALKLLQSEGELSIASTGKDQSTGRLITQEYKVEGPVMIFLTTTGIEIDEELQNRCIVLTVDEDRKQTEAIHHLQRHSQTLEGLLNRQDKSEILKVHRDAQRILRPILVANPFAKKLTFLSDKTRTRRDHLKYLTLIRAIALLHQYQREIKTVEHKGKVLKYIEVQISDIELANKLAHEVLGRSLDELAPQTRKMLLKIDSFVTEQCRKEGIEKTDFTFSRRDIREYTGFSNDQIRVHVQRLVELEYLLVHRGQRGQSYVYELIYDGQGKIQSHLNGLIDCEVLKGNKTMTTSLGGSNPNNGGPLAPQKRLIGQGSVTPLLAAKNSENKESLPGIGVLAQNAHLAKQKDDKSYLRLN